MIHFVYQYLVNVFVWVNNMENVTVGVNCKQIVTVGVNNVENFAVWANFVKKVNILKIVSISSAVNLQLF